MNIAIVIPAYNESKKIAGVLEELKTTNLPVFLIDDGSKDKTYEIASLYKVNLLRHPINLGKGAAIKTGCEAAFLEGFDGVIMMDSDGQHRVSDIQKFLDKFLERRFDIIYGTRTMSFRMPFIRMVGNKLASAFVAILFGIYISDLLCGFRGFTKKAYEKMQLKSRGYGIETEMVIKTKKCKLRYCEVSTETIYHDKFKGVTILDAFDILVNVMKWRIRN